MRYIATLLALIPGLYGDVGDPDALGIGLLSAFVIPLYIAWRTKVVGGILLILAGKKKIRPSRS